MKARMDLVTERDTFLTTLMTYEDLYMAPDCAELCTVVLHIRPAGADFDVGGSESSAREHSPSISINGSGANGLGSRRVCLSGDHVFG